MSNLNYTEVTALRRTAYFAGLRGKNATHCLILTYPLTVTLKDAGIAIAIAVGALGR